MFMCVLMYDYISSLIVIECSFVFDVWLYFYIKVIECRNIILHENTHEHFITINEEI